MVDKESLVDLKKRLRSKSETPVANEKPVFKEVPLEQLEVSRFQPRRFFDPKPLQQLANSISDHGVLQPILVRVLGDNRYEIIAGERRWRASKLAGKTTIPAVLVDKNDDDTARVSLIENIQREELDPVEEAIGIQRLMSEFELSQKSAARAIGKSESYITRMLNLIRYTSDETRSKIETGELKPNHPQVLAEIKANKKQDPNANKAGRKPDKVTGMVQVPRPLLINLCQWVAQEQHITPLSEQASDTEMTQWLAEQLACEEV